MLVYRSVTILNLKITEPHISARDMASERWVLKRVIKISGSHRSSHTP